MAKTIGIGKTLVPGLTSVEFPRVNVEHEGPTHAIQLPDKVAGQPVGIDAKVSATTRWNRASQALHDGHWKFRNRARRRFQSLYFRLESRHAISRVRRWENTRIHGESLFQQHINGPERLFDDGERGRPVGRHRFLNDVLDYFLGPLYILTKLRWRKLMNQPVPVAVRADFVAGTIDLRDHLGNFFGQPANHEESTFGLMAFEQFQDTGNVPVNTQIDRVPLRSVNVLFKRRYLEIVFDVHRKHLATGGGPGGDRTTGLFTLHGTR